MGGACSSHGVREKPVQPVQRFWLESLKRRDLSKDLGVDRIILKQILRKWVGRLRTGFICLRITTFGGLL
jgi:hypothetical protein